MRTLPIVLYLAVSGIMLSGNAVAAALDSAACARELSRLEEEFGGHLGVAARNLETGELFSYRGDERFTTASVIKLPVMAALFHQVDQKAIDLSAPITLRQEDVKPGSTFLDNVSPGLRLTLLDAVRMMIVVSDNTASNLVLDHLGTNAEEQVRSVNAFLDSKGLSQIRLLNRLYSFKTKQRTPDAILYGIGVATPAAMIDLLEKLYHHTLVDSSSCDSMIQIMGQNADAEMLPRLLPEATCKSFMVAHKTGSIEEVKADVGLVVSDRAKFAIAIFVGKHPDHLDGADNAGTLLVAHAARAVWNQYTGDTGYARVVAQGDVDWTVVPGGSWGIYRSAAAPFPHRDRAQGLKNDDGTFYPRFPHYLDSSIVVFVPDGFHETPEGTNLIVHFHGHNYDNLQVIHHAQMIQAMEDQKINALLVLPQGPYYARDSFGGKMEDEGGFKRLVQDVLSTMQREGIVKSDKIGRVIVSGHSGGYRPAGYVLDRGGLNDHVTDVFLFDAFYGQQEQFKAWLTSTNGIIHACYTDYLVEEHLTFQKSLPPSIAERFQCTKTTVEHADVVQAFFPQWLSKLAPEWKLH